MKDYTKEFDQIVAIDPGANGGLAFWRKGSHMEDISCGPMPKTRADLAMLIDDIVHLDFESTLFVVEDVPKFIAGMNTPPSAMATLHQNFGFLLGAISSYIYGRQLERSVQLILRKPADWQKAVNAGTKSYWGKGWKHHLKELACSLYPAHSREITLKTADAMLILAPLINRV